MTKTTQHGQTTTAMPLIAFSIKLTAGTRVRAPVGKHHIRAALRRPVNMQVIVKFGWLLFGHT